MDNERAHGEVRRVTLRSVRRMREYLSDVRSNAGNTTLMKGYYIVLQYADHSDRLHVKAITDNS